MTALDGHFHPVGGFECICSPLDSGEEYSSGESGESDSDGSSDEKTDFQVCWGVAIFFINTP